MNFVYSELDLIVASIFAPGRVHFDLSETEDNDVEILHDSFSAGFRRDPRELGPL